LGESPGPGKQWPSSWSWCAIRSSAPHQKRTRARNGRTRCFWTVLSHWEGSRRGQKQRGEYLVANTRPFITGAVGSISHGAHPQPVITGAEQGISHGQWATTSSHQTTMMCDDYIAAHHRGMVPLMMAVRLWREGKKDFRIRLHRLRSQAIVAGAAQVLPLAGIQLPLVSSSVVI
jgi:hypothetical protein